MQSTGRDHFDAVITGDEDRSGRDVGRADLWPERGNVESRDGQVPERGESDDVVGCVAPHSSLARLFDGRRVDPALTGPMIELAIGHFGDLGRMRRRHHMRRIRCHHMAHYTMRASCYARTFSVKWKAVAVRVLPLVALVVAAVASGTVVKQLGSSRGK